VGFVDKVEVSFFDFSPVSNHSTVALHAHISEDKQ
jgi:hypothetical protein